MTNLRLTNSRSRWRWGISGSTGICRVFVFGFGFGQTSFFAVTACRQRLSFRRQTAHSISVLKISNYQDLSSKIELKCWSFEYFRSHYVYSYYRSITRRNLGSFRAKNPVAMSQQKPFQQKPFQVTGNCTSILRDSIVFNVAILLNATRINYNCENYKFYAQKQKGNTLEKDLRRQNSLKLEHAEKHYKVTAHKAIESLITAPSNDSRFQ